jgi:iron-sulfur cluster assembly protein
MITLTPTAAKQVKHSAKESNLDGLPLRLACTRMEDGSFHYGMGFDDVKEGDVTHTSEGIDVIVSITANEFMNGTTVDFVELEEGKEEFIFMNPNDPSYVPPAKK